MSHLETTAVHGGHLIDPSTGAVTPPIHLSTTFERQADGSYPPWDFFIRAAIIPTGRRWKAV